MPTRSQTRGRHRDGDEKIAPLPDDSPLLSSAYASWQPVPKHAHLDYRVDLETQNLRVRRRRVTPHKQDQQRTQARRKLAVIGGQHARERGAAPAYYRTISPRSVTFQCHVCKQTVTQHLLPGPTPRYCSDLCRDEARRQKTLERVRRLRELRREDKQSTTT